MGRRSGVGGRVSEVGCQRSEVGCRRTGVSPVKKEVVQMLLENVSMSGKSPNNISPAIISAQEQTMPEKIEESGKEENSADLSRMKDVVIDLQNKMRVAPR